MGGFYGFGSFQKLSFFNRLKIYFLIDPNCYLKGGVADRPINRLIGEPSPDDGYIWASVFLGSVGPGVIGSGVGVGGSAIVPTLMETIGLKISGSRAG